MDTIALVNIHEYIPTFYALTSFANYITRVYVYMFRAICQFAQFRNCAVQIRNFQTVQKIKLR